MVGAGIVAAFQIGKAPAALAALRAELALSLTQAAWVISIFNAIGVVAGMALGALAERLGPRRAVLAGLCLIAVASALGAAAQGPALLLATRFAEGLGFMVVVVTAPALLVATAAPADLKLAFGLWSTYMPAGTATMMALAPLLLGASGWRALWMFNAAIVLGFAVVLGATTRGMGSPRAGAPLSLAADLMLTLRAPGPRLLALLFAVYALHYLAVFGFLPTLLIERDGVSPALAAVLGAIAVAVNVPGNLTGGWLVHRGAPRWPLVAAASVAMGLCSLAIYAGGLGVGARYALCLVLSAVGGLIPAVVLGAGPTLAPSPRHVATTNGLIMQGSNLGQLIGPPSVAALAASAGGDWSRSPLVLCTAAACGVVLAWRLQRLEKKVGSER